MKHLFHIFFMFSLIQAFPVSSQELNPVQLSLVPWADGIGQIVSVTHCGDGRLFAVSQWGAIFIVTDSMEVAEAPFLNIYTQIVNDGERGMIGLAFDPDYAQNGYFYVQYMHMGGQYGVNTLSRFQVSSDPDIADPASEVVLYSYVQPTAIHQGGDIQFDLDGYLNVAFGDGGWGGDPNNRAQSLNTPMGKILRIKPELDGSYSIPPDNPFANAQGDTLREILAYGLRNPYRIGIDRANGDLWIGDVGQESYEEINRWPDTATGAPNFGWRCYEGSAPFDTTGCEGLEAYVPPVIAMPHPLLGGNSCAIVGGKVYRGNVFPRLEGRYLFTDFCSGEFRMVWPDGIGGWNNALGLATQDQGFSSIGEGANGELYATHLFDNRLYKLVDQCPMDPPVAAISGGLLQGTGADAYHWVLAGDTVATGSTYEPIEQGWYTVVGGYVGGCQLRSDSVLYLVTGMGAAVVQGLRIHPQPANDMLTVDALVPNASDLALRLFDTMGRTVLRSAWRKGTTRHTMDVSSVVSGTYVLELRTTNGDVIERRTVSVLR